MTQIINAVDTSITIKTLPYHTVDVSVLEPGKVYSLIGSFREYSGSEGIVIKTFSANIGAFNARVWLRDNNGKIVVYERFENNYPTGIPVVFEVYPDWYIIEEEAEENISTQQEPVPDPNLSPIKIETTTTQEVHTQKPFFVGLKESFSRVEVIYYGIFVGFALVVVGFFLMKKFGVFEKYDSGKDDKKPRYKKETPKLPPPPPKPRLDNVTRRIEKAERKIMDAQREIRKAKNQGRINEMLAKIEDDKIKLEMLKRSE